MNPKAIFERLDAPLHNTIWSWGAVRERDGAVFLRAWQTDSRMVGGKRCIWVGDVEQTDKSNGSVERHRHLDLIRKGAKTYVVIVRASATGKPGIEGVNAKTIFVGGELIEEGGNILLSLVDRIPMDAARLRPGPVADTDDRAGCGQMT